MCYNPFLSLVFVVVNFMCQPLALRDAQITGKTLFLNVSVTVFLEEISL